MRKRAHKALVLTGAALVVCLLVLSGWHVFSARLPALAKRLPADTLLWVSIQDTESIVTVLGGESSVGELVGMLAEEQEAREFVSEYFGAELDKETGARLIEWLQTVKAVDIVFDGIRIRHGAPVPELVVMLEFSSRDAAKDTQGKLDGIFGRKDDLDGTPIYYVEGELAEEMEEGLEPCLAVHGARLVFALDGRTMGEALDMLQNGSGRSLAKSNAFRRLAKGTGRMGALGWIGPDIVDELLDLAPRREQASIRAAVRALGLDELEGVLTTADYRSGKGLLRLALDEDGALAKTFALPSTRRSFASLAPGDAWFLGSLSIGDGKEAWERFSDYLYDVLKATGEVGDRKEFRAGMAGMEERLGVGPGDIAAVVSAIGLCIGGDLSNPQFGVLFRVNDEKDARNLLERLGQSRAFSRQKPRTVQAQGETIHVLASDFCYVILDDTVCLSQRPDALVGLVKAWKSGETLANSEAYVDIADRLPEAAGARLFYDVAGLIQGLGEEAGPFARLLDKRGSGSGSLGSGLALRCEKGMFEATTASPRSETVGEVFALGMTEALRDARDKSRRFADCGNLKQLATGMYMYCDDNRELMPPDLGLLLPYMGDTDVFRCPAARRPSPKDAEAIRRGDCDYVYLRPARNRSRIPAPSEEPMMATRPGLLADGWINVAYVDGHVEGHSLDSLPPRLRQAFERHFGPDWLRKLRAR